VLIIIAVVRGVIMRRIIFRLSIVTSTISVTISVARVISNWPIDIMVSSGPVGDVVGGCWIGVGWHMSAECDAWCFSSISRSAGVSCYFSLSGHNKRIEGGEFMELRRSSELGGQDVE
jgi:hypothetical protein